MVHYVRMLVLGLAMVALAGCAAVRLLGKFDIVETVRTGKVVMARGLETT